AHGRTRPPRRGRGRLGPRPSDREPPAPAAPGPAQRRPAMKLNTPRWWYTRDRRHGAVARLLLKPASWIWTAATARRLARARPVDPGPPVVSIGNLTVGGSGKTPVAREVLRLLRAAGVDAHVLSRGYGGSLEGPTRVDPAAHTAAEVGDEPLML